MRDASTAVPDGSSLRRGTAVTIPLRRIADRRRRVNPRREFSARAGATPPVYGRIAPDTGLAQFGPEDRRGKGRRVA
jgi:hypothetical protein